VWSFWINPLHDPLSEDHRTRDNRMQSLRWSRIVQLTELPGCQDRGHDPDHALAAFVHRGTEYPFRPIFANMFEVDFVRHLT